MLSNRGPINDKKTSPITNLKVLGLGIDTISQTISLQNEKWIELRGTLLFLFVPNKVTLKEMQSLCGSLLFFSKEASGSRAFTRRFYNSTIAIRKSCFWFRVTQCMKLDSKVWLDFLEKLLLNTDNLALVHILNSQTSKSERVMQQVRPLVPLSLKHDLQIKNNPHSWL